MDNKPIISVSGFGIKLTIRILLLFYDCAKKSTQITCFELIVIM